MHIALLGKRVHTFDHTETASQNGNQGDLGAVDGFTGVLESYGRLILQQSKVSLNL